METKYQLRFFTQEYDYHNDEIKDESLMLEYLTHTKPIIPRIGELISLEEYPTELFRVTDICTSFPPKYSTREEANFYMIDIIIENEGD